MKKTKKFLAVFLALFFLFGLLPAAALASAPDITASSALLINLDTGIVLYDKNSTAKISPSSLTKIMTAILVLEKVQSLDSEVTVSASAVADVSGLSTASLKVGEIISVRNLLSCVLVRSAGDACNVLAEYVSGSVESFVAEMNKKAEQLGMSNTHFVNPHGRDDANQITTLADLCLLANYALQNPQFMELCNVQYKYIPETNMTGKRYYYSTNNMIISNPAQRNEAYYYKYATGIMSAYSEQAGYSLITTAQKDGIRLLALVSGSTKDAEKQIHSYLDVKSLFSWCFDNYKLEKILKKGVPVCEVSLKLSAQSDKLILTTSEDFQTLIPLEADVNKLERKIETRPNLRAPIEKGEEIGTITFLYEGKSYGSAKLIASAGAERNFFLFILDSIATFLKSTAFRVALAVVILLIVLYTLLFVRNNRHGRRRKNRSRYRR